MIDIHSHILPGIDDGAKSWEVAEQMCRMAMEDGITHIVCSPHANDEFSYDRSKHEHLLTELRTRVPQLEFSLGCDFHLSFDNIRALLESPQQFLIANGPYLLVEFSDYAIPPSLIEALGRMRESGIIPVITHPERNAVLQRNLKLVNEFVAAGYVIQVTADSLTGRWGPTASKCAEQLLDAAQVHVLATDAHDTRSRPPVLSKAREWVAATFGQALADSLTAANPASIVAGSPLAAT
jgi:protein-tyrosine phosphatase